MIGTAGYYAAYVYVIWRTISGSLTIGTLTFLTGAIVQGGGEQIRKELQDALVAAKQ